MKWKCQLEMHPMKRKGKKKSTEQEQKQNNGKEKVRNKKCTLHFSFNHQTINLLNLQTE